MRSTSIILAASVCALLIPASVAAQEAGTTDATGTTVTTGMADGEDDDEFPWGLLGLIGLAGLIPRKRNDTVHDRTAIR